jgi:hypothetical protein
VCGGAGAGASISRHVSTSNKPSVFEYTSLYETTPNHFPLENRSMHDKKPWFAAVLVLAMGMTFAPSPVAAEPPKGADAPAKSDDLKKLAASLDGYIFMFPCKGDMPDKPKPGADCDSALVKGDPKKTDNFTAEKTFGGEKGKRYAVTLRFRGVVEPMMYKGGKMDGDLFYIGGEPNNATYNIYKITVSSPESHYFVNRQDKVGHRIFTIDYTKTIEIEGGATVTFFGDGQNGRLISNFLKLTVPEVSSEIKQPFHGQFVQVNVVDVAEMKPANP